jgi:hypothetical protein
MVPRISLVHACRVREWLLDSNVTFLKCLGGAQGAEGIVAACKDGQVVNIFINNPFPIKLWKHHTAVRLVDLSAQKRLLAIVDEKSQLTVINLELAQVPTLSPFLPCVHALAWTFFLQRQWT